MDNIRKWLANKLFKLAAAVAKNKPDSEKTTVKRPTTRKR